MDNVSKHTNSADAQARADAWLDTQAVTGWLVFGLYEDHIEVIGLTEAGQAAAALLARTACDICGHSAADHATDGQQRCGEYRCDCPGYCNFADLD